MYKCEAPFQKRKLQGTVQIRALLVPTQNPNVFYVVERVSIRGRAGWGRPREKGAGGVPYCIRTGGKGTTKDQSMSGSAGRRGPLFFFFFLSLLLLGHCASE